MRRSWLLIGLLSLSLMLLVPSAAFQTQNSGPDRINEAIELSPSDAPHGKYAVLNDDTGEIELRFGPKNPNLDGEGVNIGTQTPFNDVFTVRNNGSEPGEIWFTVETDGLRFYRGTDTDESLMGESNAIELKPDQQVNIGVLIDATNEDVESVDEFTVHAQSFETTQEETDSDTGFTGGFSALDTDSTPSISVTAPDETTRSVIFENISSGDTLSTDLDRLVIDRKEGELVLEEITITSGSKKNVHLTITSTEGDTPSLSEEPGLLALGAVDVEHSQGVIDRSMLRFVAEDSYLAACGLEAAQLEFYRTSDEASEPLALSDTENTDRGIGFDVPMEGISDVTVMARVPAFRITETSLSTENATVGESVTVQATLENQGLALGQTTIPVTYDSERVASETVELEPNTSAEVSIPIRPTQPGEYRVEVSDVGVGTLVVTEEQTTTTPTPTTTADSESTDSSTTTNTESSNLGGAETTTTPAETTETTKTTVQEVEQIEEPAGLGLSDIGGLTFGVGIALSLLYLIRRRPTG